MQFTLKHLLLVFPAFALSLILVVALLVPACTLYDYERVPREMYSHLSQIKLALNVAASRTPSLLELPSEKGSTSISRNTNLASTLKGTASKHGDSINRQGRFQGPENGTPSQRGSFEQEAALERVNQ